jgi:hypothetical protein
VWQAPANSGPRRTGHDTDTSRAHSRTTTARRRGAGPVRGSSRPRGERCPPWRCSSCSSSPRTETSRAPATTATTGDPPRSYARRLRYPLDPGESTNRRPRGMTRRPFDVSRSLWLLGVLWLFGLVAVVAWPQRRGTPFSTRLTTVDDSTRPVLADPHEAWRERGWDGDHRALVVDHGREWTGGGGSGGRQLRGAFPVRLLHRGLFISAVGFVGTLTGVSDSGLGGSCTVRGAAARSHARRAEYEDWVVEAKRVPARLARHAGRRVSADSGDSVAAARVSPRGGTVRGPGSPGVALTAEQRP